MFFKKINNKISKIIIAFIPKLSSMKHKNLQEIQSINLMDEQKETHNLFYSIKGFQHCYHNLKDLKSSMKSKEPLYVGMFEQTYLLLSLSNEHQANQALLKILIIVNK